MISTTEEKAYTINANTIRELGKCATREWWADYQIIGVLAQDSANISPGIKHNYVRNWLVDGDEFHRIGSLTQMYQVMVHQVRDIREEEILVAGENASVEDVSEEMPHSKHSQIFIMG